MPSPDLTLTIALTPKQPCELVRTTKNILSLQKCPLIWHLKRGTKFYICKMYKSPWIVGWYFWIRLHQWAAYVRNLCSCLSPLYLQQLHHSREAFMETQKEYIVVCRLNKRQWHKENSCWEIHLWKVKPHSKKKKNQSCSSPGGS